MFDPKNDPIEADLSRNDVIVLHKFCNKKRVVEFGAGGSTLILAQIAKNLVSYETNQKWIDKVAKTASERSLQKFSIKLIHPYSTSLPAEELQKADVLFLDGSCDLRHHILEYAIKLGSPKVILIHDSRRADPISYCDSLIKYPLFLILDTVSYHYLDSNMVVVKLRDKAVAYENWNSAEQNRLPHLAIDK